MHSGIKSRIVYEVSRTTHFPVSYICVRQGLTCFFLFFSICKRFDFFFFLQMNDVRMIGVTDMSY